MDSRVLLLLAGSRRSMAESRLTKSTETSRKDANLAIYLADRSDISVMETYIAQNGGEILAMTRDRRLSRSLFVGVLLCAGVLFCGGCSFGPRTVYSGRLQYNEAVKTTSEQQLLLNIVRLRYTDSPSSLALSSIADQRELVGSLGLVPFFASAGAGDVGSYRSSVLPSATFTGTTRPTLSYTPMDDQEFTRRLFTPISLEGTAYLSKTTWPISTVFRLYLENLNWVSNAETASGPTPDDPPEYADFLSGVEALQRLQDRKLIALFQQQSEQTIASGKSSEDLNASDQLEAIKQGHRIQTESDGAWKILRIEKKPVLRVGSIDPWDEDFQTFCQNFKLNPELRSFELSADAVDPFYAGMPPSGLEKLDLETRSLLQVLFFVAHGVEVPAEHSASGIAPSTGFSGEAAFDWSRVMHGLIAIKHCKGRRPPACASVAIQYKDYWFYIDDRDRNSKATFCLLLEVSRLELNTPENTGPMLTLPLGG